MLDLTDEQKEILEPLTRCRNSPQWLAQRAHIVLLLAAGFSLRKIARHLHLSKKTVQRWGQRWKMEAPNLIATQDLTESDPLYGSNVGASQR
jgi:DNA invertase Pin-like site-specific DNA recombinase